MASASQRCARRSLLPPIYHFPFTIFHAERKPRGFTLIELMISIALALLLILGINAVFKYTTTAVGQGQAINAATRDSRAAQTVFSNDFSAIVPNGTGPTDAACIILRSCAIPAFRDRADQLSDKDGLPLTIDIDGNGKEGETTVPGEIISPATYNFRNHREDCLSFFARSLYPRQTGNLGTYADQMSSQEAWIWYGHLWLPDNNMAYLSGGNPSQPLTFPGAGGSSSVNPNNYYATQFVLGRVAMLLREKSIDSSAGQIRDNSGVPQQFIDRRYTYVTLPTTASELDPFRPDSPVATSDATAPWYLQNSRYDLATTTIANFQKKFLTYQYNNYAWWDEMMDGNPLPNSSLNPPPPPTAIPSGFAGRFQCNPYIAKPVDAAKIAQTSPYFLPGCTQFIVEYAGDFVQQDNDPSHVPPNVTARVAATPNFYGDIIGLGQDGQLDYTILNGVKQIKWYGMPRNVGGNLTQNGNDGGRINFATSLINNDVVPLRDWLEWDAWNPLPAKAGQRLPLGAAFTFNAPFEKLPLPPYYPNYTDTTGAGMTTTDTANGYICAWGPSDTPPSLIRITITLTDTSGRLPDGLTYQFVFPVPQPQ